MKKTVLSLGIIAAVTAFTSCSDNSDTKTEEQILAESKSKPDIQISREVFDEMIQSLPQPIEIANIITKAKMPFSKEMLVPSENASAYSNKYYQAMAFGAYGVDLGYINLNDKKIYVIEYLEAVKTLADELKVDQFFDFQTLYDMTKNRHNADSLIHISTRNFNRIDEFLREENRGELSVLILIGSWTEGMHMFGQLYKKEPDADLLMRIGEQKVVFENVMLILEKLSKIEHFAQLKSDAANIKTAFEKAKISYEYHAPETREVNGELEIIDKTETKVDLTREDALKIIEVIDQFRNKYLLTNKK